MANLGKCVTAVLQFLWSLWIEHWVVCFHPSKQQSLAGDPGGKTPLDRIGSALHQLENCYRTERYRRTSRRHRQIVLRHPQLGGYLVGRFCRIRAFAREENLRFSGR